MRKLLLILGAAFALLVFVSIAAGSGDDDEVTVKPIDGDLSEEFTQVDADEEIEVDVPDVLRFGQAHTREPGVGGHGWTISIDSAMWDVPKQYEVDQMAGMQCLAIVGTATLDSLETDATPAVSNPFSFPDVWVIVDGNRADLAFGCDRTAVPGQEVTAIAITEGTTVEWYKLFAVPEGVTAADQIGIEEIEYRP